MGGYDFDLLQMYMGRDYVINDYITVHQPTIGEIVDMGEKKYFTTLYYICAIPSDMKSQLWDVGVDWEEISDFELFCMLYQTFEPEDTKIFFGDLDFKSLQLAVNKENDEIILINVNTGLVIDPLIYQKMVDYLRKMHGIKPKIEHAANAYTKKYLIEEDRDNIAMNKNKPYKSTLLPLISAMCHSAGFKYKKNDLNEIGIFEFMDSVQRIPLINSSTALLHGCYGGMIDSSKIKKDDLNWFKDLSQ